MIPKSWVVYKTKEDKVDAVENNHDTTIEKLEAEGHIILGNPYFVRKDDAINWVLHDHWPNGKRSKNKA